MFIELQVSKNVPRSIIKGTRSTYYDYIGGLDSGIILKDLLVVADKLTPRINKKTPKYVIKSPWFDPKTGMINCPKTPDDSIFHYLLINSIGITTKRITLPAMIGSRSTSRTVNINWKPCCAKSVYKDFG